MCDVLGDETKADRVIFVGLLLEVGPS
jgi:hypothetical protein